MHKNIEIYNQEGKTINEDINLQAIGVVNTDIDDPLEMPMGGKLARVDIFPAYQQALLRIEENSHLWLLLWFHKSDRNILSTRPVRVNPDLPEYGVFSLRAYNRPNPIGLTKVKLEKVEGNFLWVSGLDAINGTPVLDIKPYYESDIVFSPRTPYIRPYNRQMRLQHFHRHALTYHQEECNELLTGVRMVMEADEYLGQVTEPDVIVAVYGSRCLADTIQGLTLARLANPTRFIFIESDEKLQSQWTKGEHSLILTSRQHFNQENFWDVENKELLKIEYK